MNRQYGAIPFLRDESGIRVVLITSASGCWIFPKGRYEKRLGKPGTARMEALEEAGVKGRLHRKPRYRAKVQIRSGDRVRLTLYPLEVKTLLERWDEKERRKRQIVTIEEAAKLIDSDALLTCLHQFEDDFREE